MNNKISKKIFLLVLLFIYIHFLAYFALVHFYVILQMFIFFILYQVFRCTVSCFLHLEINISIFCITLCCFCIIFLEDN